MEHTEDYVKLENVSKIYGSKEVKIIAVDEISFRIKKGEFVVVVGPSGAGKTTVLNILGGMDSATSAMSGRWKISQKYHGPTLTDTGGRILDLYSSFIIWCQI